jgi:hypothetical protein
VKPVQLSGTKKGNEYLREKKVSLKQTVRTNISEIYIEE